MSKTVDLNISLNLYESMDLEDVDSEGMDFGEFSGTIVSTFSFNNSNDCNED